MAQYEAVTGRRPKINYGKMLRAEAPGARSRYIINLAQEQEREQMEKQRKLTEEQMKAQQRQSDTSSGIATGGLALEGYDLLAGGGEVAAGGTEAGSVAGLGAESGGAGAEASGVGAGSEGAGLGTYAGIAAAIAAQKGLSNSITNEYKGQPYRDILYTDPETGSYEPAAGSEPWREWLGGQTGAYDDKNVSAGREFDTAIYNAEYGKAAQELPATVAGWGNPMGEVLYDNMDKAFGLDRGSNVSSAFRAAIDPASAIGNVISGNTHFCTAIAKHVGIASVQLGILKIFRSYCCEKHRDMTEHYMEHGGKLVDKINESIDNVADFWHNVKQDMVVPVLKFMAEGDMEKAANLYKKVYLGLLEKYTPELMPEV